MAKPTPSRNVDPDHSYDAWQRFQFHLGGQEVVVISKPGFADWDTITPADVLLSEAVHVPNGGKVVLVGGRHGALGVALARQAGSSEFSMVDTNWVAAGAAQRTLAANDIVNAVVATEPAAVLTWPSGADVVVIQAPRDRRLARRYLLESHRVLKPGGSVYVAGANNLGIRSVIDDAGHLFRNGVTVDVRMKHRVARFERLPEEFPDLPWTSEPGFAPGTWARFTLTARGTTLNLASLPGVFAHDHIDPATLLLIEHMNVPANARVLDIGCGGGVIGLTAARLGAAHVDLVDADLFSVAATTENIAVNRIGNVSVFPSDVLSAVADRRYDLVLTNPPFHAGRNVDLHTAVAFITQAHAALLPGGNLLLVANRFLLSHYEPIVRASYGNARLLAATRSFGLLAATRDGAIDQV